MIVVFDAQCLLCNGWVKFLLRHDRKGVFRFASIQGIAGQTLLAQANLKVEGLETLLLIDGQRIWQHTGAIFRALGALGWPWRLAWIGWLVPAQVRDPLYRLLARNRYRVFGRLEECAMPPADYKARFLD
jgi:predicted DCC family thiol-disulfide oxidoreductase YuxK